MSQKVTWYIVLSTCTQHDNRFSLGGGMQGETVIFSRRMSVVVTPVRPCLNDLSSYKAVQRQKNNLSDAVESCKQTEACLLGFPKAPRVRGLSCALNIFHLVVVLKWHGARNSQ